MRAGRRVKAPVSGSDTSKRIDVDAERPETITSALPTDDARTQEAVRRLARDVAHDLNNLLTMMVGFTRLVIDTFDEQDQRRRDLQQVLTACDRASQLTDDLLSARSSRQAAALNGQPNIQVSAGLER